MIEAEFRFSGYTQGVVGLVCVACDMKVCDVKVGSTLADVMRAVEAHLHPDVVVS